MLIKVLFAFVCILILLFLVNVLYELYFRYIKKKYRVTFDISYERFKKIQKNALINDCKVENYIRSSVNDCLRDLADPER